VTVRTAPLLWSLGLPGCAGSQEVPAGSLIEALDELGRPITLRVDAVEPDPLDPHEEILLYTVSVVRDGVAAPYCSPDPQGRTTAVALSGSWDASGDPHPSEHLTIGCTSGAIGKCVRMGYAPWRTLDGESLAPYHTACMRMIRADYCGDGRPHTVDGTWVDTWDRLGLQRREPDRPTAFEAGWSEHGATFVQKARWTDDLAGLVAECPERLTGRTSLDGSRTPEQVAADFPETRLFVEHAALDSDKKRPSGGPFPGPSAPRPRPSE
jgi:hypothetical protein